MSEETVPLWLVSDNEQDRAACRDWWRLSTEEEKIAVWFLITTHWHDPETEVMSRFAQLAFGEMAEAVAREKEGETS